MKTLENGVAKLQDLSLAEMKNINGGVWVTVVINGTPTKLWIE
ncbi:MAG: hypothetical protein ACOYOT_02780 [Bacteroidales bacterium]